MRTLIYPPVLTGVTLSIKNERLRCFAGITVPCWWDPILMRPFRFHCNMLQFITILSICYVPKVAKIVWVLSSIGYCGRCRQIERGFIQRKQWFSQQQAESCFLTLLLFNPQQTCIRGRRQSSTKCFEQENSLRLLRQLYSGSAGVHDVMGHLFLLPYLVLNTGQWVTFRYQ